MANSQIAVTEGSGKNIASYSITETTSKELQRTTINDSAGTELGTSTNPIRVSVSSIIGSLPAGTALIGGISSVVGAVTPYAQPSSYVWGVSSISTSTTASSVLAAPGASLRNYITTIKVTNAAANGVIVDIKDSGGDVLDSGYAAASGGGWSTTFTVPIRQTSTAKSVDVVPRSQGSVIAAIVGYVAA